MKTALFTKVDISFVFNFAFYSFFLIFMNTKLNVYAKYIVNCRKHNKRVHVTNSLKFFKMP